MHEPQHRQRLENLLRVENTVNHSVAKRGEVTLGIEGHGALTHRLEGGEGGVEGVE